MSGVTLIALAANEIVMGDNAVLGPVDPQLGEYPTASLVKLVQTKPVAEVCQPPTEAAAFSERGKMFDIVLKIKQSQQNRVKAYFSIQSIQRLRLQSAVLNH
jgi:ClpP class serine protease